MSNSTFAALRTIVGVAKEPSTAKGTPVAATAYPVVKKFDGHDKQVKIIDNGWRGSMGDDYGMQNGPRSSEVDMSGDVFVDTIPWLLTGVLGAIATTGAAAPFTHAIALQNSGDGQPGSQTWTDSEGGLQTRQYAGCQVSELTLKFDASGLMNFDAKLVGWASKTAAAPTATYTTVVPLPVWSGAVTIGGSASAAIQNMEIAIKRKSVETIFTVGAQDPYQVHVGGLDVTTKYTFVAADESRLLAYLNNTQEALVATFNQGANASLALQMSQHNFDDAKVVRGKSYMEVEGTGRAMLNATDPGTAGGGGLAQLLATVKNAVAAGTYQ